MVFACSLQIFASRTETPVRQGAPDRGRGLCPAPGVTPQAPLPRACALSAAKRPPGQRNAALQRREAPMAPRGWLTQSLTMPEHSNLACAAAVTNILPGCASHFLALVLQRFTHMLKFYAGRAVRSVASSQPLPDGERSVGASRSWARLSLPVPHRRRRSHCLCGSHKSQRCLFNLPQAPCTAKGRHQLS